MLDDVMLGRPGDAEEDDGPADDLISAGFAGFDAADGAAFGVGGELVFTTGAAAEIHGFRLADLLSRVF